MKISELSLNVIAMGSFLMAASASGGASAVPANPLLAVWTGPYGGVPPFDQIKLEDFKPALEQAMAAQRKEIESIANNPAPPTFENTSAAFDHCGDLLARVSSIYEVWAANLNTPEFQQIQKEMSPKFAALHDEIMQNSNLFKRIDAVYNAPTKTKLTSEQQRLVWVQETEFIRNGARLDNDKKTKVAAINQRLASLYTEFNQNELGDEEHDPLILEKASDLDGMPASFVEAAAAAAEKEGKKGHFLIANTRSAMQPLLTYATHRAVREKAFKIWTSRGDNGNAHDNNKIVVEILKLRAERSKIYGFPSFAHWKLSNTMAKDPAVAMELMMKVWKPAVERAHQEVADMQAIVDAEKGNFKIKPWDYRFYAEKVRKAKYDLDFDLVKPYLQLDHIQKAMFWSANALYGFQFVQIHDIPIFEKTVTTYKVLDKKGHFVGLWYFDPSARAGKNSGAWMTGYRAQYKEGGKDIRPFVSNNANFIPGKAGTPILISWDDAVTMFHEFGHALHGLNSDVTYRTLSGTNTTSDFVEFPSQMNENYLRTPEVLKLLVNQEGQALPQTLIEKINNASTFNQGFSTVELLASAIVDMKLHLETAPIDPHEFEKKTLKELGMPEEIVMRHRIPQFGHVFSNEEYAAGYYGYVWAEVLDYDAFEAFTESKGGPYDKAVAKKYHDHIVSVGNTIDPSETYRKFRGRDPKVDALLRSRGFPVPVQ